MRQSSTRTTTATTTVENADGTENGALGFYGAMESVRYRRYRCSYQTGIFLSLKRRFVELNVDGNNFIVLRLFTTLLAPSSSSTTMTMETPTKIYRMTGRRIDVDRIMSTANSGGSSRRLLGEEKSASSNQGIIGGTLAVKEEKYGVVVRGPDFKLDNGNEAPPLTIYVDSINELESIGETILALASASRSDGSCMYPMDPKSIDELKRKQTAKSPPIQSPSPEPAAIMQTPPHRSVAMAIMNACFYIAQVKAKDPPEGIFNVSTGEPSVVLDSYHKMSNGQILANDPLLSTLDPFIVSDVLLEALSRLNHQIFSFTNFEKYMFKALKVKGQGLDASSITLENYAQSLLDDTSIAHVRLMQDISRGIWKLAKSLNVLSISDAAAVFGPFLVEGMNKMNGSLMRVQGRIFPILNRDAIPDLFDTIVLLLTTFSATRDCKLFQRILDGKIIAWTADSSGHGSSRHLVSTSSSRTMNSEIAQSTTSASAGTGEGASEEEEKIGDVKALPGERNAPNEPTINVASIPPLNEPGSGDGSEPRAGSGRKYRRNDTTSSMNTTGNNSAVDDGNRSTYSNVSNVESLQASVTSAEADSYGNADRSRQYREIKERVNEEELLNAIKGVDDSRKRKEMESGIGAMRTLDTSIQAEYLSVMALGEYELVMERSIQRYKERLEEDPENPNSILWKSEIGELEKELNSYRGMKESDVASVRQDRKLKLDGDDEGEREIQEIQEIVQADATGSAQSSESVDERGGEGDEEQDIIDDALTAWAQANSANSLGELENILKSVKQLISSLGIMSSRDLDRINRRSTLSLLTMLEDNVRLRIELFKSQ